jgi:hypothetical protein
VFESSGVSADTVKAITRYLCLGDKLISAHPLGYGGATLLAAAGVPSYIITYFGGWSEDSKMVRRYAQLGGQAVDNVSRIMSEAFGESVAETRIRMNTLSGK